MRKPIAIGILILLLMFQPMLPFPVAQAQGITSLGMMPLSFLPDCGKESKLLSAAEFEPLNAALQKQVAESPADPEVLFNHANTLYEQKQYKEAITRYTQLLQIDPDYPEAQAKRGHAYSEIGEWALALQDVTLNIEKNPESSKAYFSRGTVYFDQEDYARALVDYQKALSFDGQDKCIHNNMAISYEMLGSSEAALHHYNRALEIDPSFGKALRNRRDYYWHQGSYFKSMADSLRLIFLSNSE